MSFVVVVAVVAEFSRVGVSKWPAKISAGARVEHFFAQIPTCYPTQTSTHKFNLLFKAFLVRFPLPKPPKAFVKMVSTMIPHVLSQGATKDYTVPEYAS